MLTRAESWAVIDRIAASLGVKYQARRKWRARGKVPGRWHLAILQKAKAEALDLDPDALSDFRLSARRQRGKGAGPDTTTTPHRRGRHLRIEAGGRVTIPQPVLEELDLKVGDPVILAVEGDELRLRSLQRAIADVQALVRQYVPTGVSLADELIAERRREAELE